MANKFPEEDWRSITLLMKNLEQVKCKTFVLVSTIDVYKTGIEVDEDSKISENGLMPYGSHRVILERLVKTVFPSAYIIRLPGIFGKGLRKNFIFDLIFRIPKMISSMECNRLKCNLNEIEKELINSCYEMGLNGILCLKSCLSKNKLVDLRKVLQRAELTSLRFTDSRSLYSYYDLSDLKKDLKHIITQNIHLINLVTEPMMAGEISELAFDYTFINRLEGKNPFQFRIRSKYDEIFHGSRGYLYDKEQVIKKLREFNRDSISY
jgi:hypothetical protein